LSLLLKSYSAMSLDICIQKDEKLVIKTKQKVNERLRRIANVLMLNASFIDNLGLLNGKMGIAIFFYHYARYTGSKILEDYAGELIDEIYEEISTNTPLDFANGLTGIGWGIEYLEQKGFLEADTDEILQDIDKTVYQKILLDFNNNELQGYLLYYLNRNKAKNNANNKKEFLKNRAFLCLFRKCENLLGYSKFKEQNNATDLNTLNTIRYFFSEINKTGLFPRKTRKVLDLLPSHIEIATANKEIEKVTLVDRATAISWQQLVFPSTLSLGTDINSIFQEAFKFIDDEENWNNYIKQLSTNSYGIHKGLAGIGITLLGLISDFNSQKVEMSKTQNTSSKQSENSLSVFVFKSNARGMQYGMGTYIRELTEALLTFTDINLYIVTYHDNHCKEFSTEVVSSRLSKINIPSPQLDFYKKKLFETIYAPRVVDLLTEVISKHGKIIFQMNYIDDLPILEKLKERFTYPIISIVHFAQWQQIFNGNKKKLKGLNLDYPSDNVEFTLSKEREMYRLSDHIISVTHYMKDFLINEYRINQDKIDIVPNAVNLDGFNTLSQNEKRRIKSDLGFNQNEKIILFSGRIDPCKGIFFLFEAFIDACRHRNDLRLVLVGLGALQDCLKKYRSCYGRITYTGYLPSEQIKSFYQIADVGVVPSIYDHCPYTVLEMMAYKVPLVLSNINGLNEMSHNSECLFIEPKVSEDGEITFDYKEISNAILILVSDSQIGEKQALNAYDNLRNNFSTSSFALKMNRIYSSLINTK
jgi:glycosyltransferase involved in cell wall biosynthesis